MPLPPSTGTETTGTAAAPGPVHLGPDAHTTLRPADRAHLTGGLWHQRRAVNARASIPDGLRRLEEAGNLHNLRLAAGTADGAYVNDLPFMDSDLYKWLEAAAWQLGDPATDPEQAERLTRDVADATRLLARAQRPDGYLQSYYQVVKPDARWQDLAWGHELYCAGHLIQAAVAHHRTTGRDDLLDVARRFADHVCDTFGPGENQTDGVGGHPEIETALVELYRCTGERRYLRTARYFVDRRGHHTLPDGRFGRHYWQDHVPVRDAEAVAGHAVRQLYLLAGVVDVYAETGDTSLLAAAERLWEEMAATKTYLTGGIGSHHTDESFGDPYELPPERAYTETCAAIASAMLSWRLLLATGKARYADQLERVLLNGVLSGVSLDGTHYVYVNPLQVRDRHLRAAGDHGAFRTRWFRCACCPPNVMRLLASLPHYMAAADGQGLVLHQYATGGYSAGVGEAAGTAAVEVETDYPWRGTVTVTVTASPEREWTLTLRVPHWAAPDEVGLRVDGEPLHDVASRVEDGWLRLRRRWRPGESVVLELPLRPRLTAGPARADAIRGCVALERGPLVYCVERVDQPDGTRLDDLRLVPSGTLGERAEPELLGGVVTVTATGRTVPPPDGDAWWPYADAAVAGAATGANRAVEPFTVTAVPYHVWAHREEGPMRVWLPLDGADTIGRTTDGQDGPR